MYATSLAVTSRRTRGLILGTCQAGTTNMSCDTRLAAYQQSTTRLLALQLNLTPPPGTNHKQLNNGMVERLCKEEDVGYMDLWDSFVGNEDMYVRDGLHLSGKGVAVFAEGLSGAVASGLGKVRYLN